jgi:hypothetical protein
MEHAQNVVLSAQVRGLTLCDVLRQIYGDELGRQIYRDHKMMPDISLYPPDVIQKVHTFH